MWQSEEDLIKDLALLNDFGAPDDIKPYKAMYSKGRGINIKEKRKIQGNFLDPRTGEAIEVEKAELDINDDLHKSKGRGSLFGTFSRERLQLQQQLRLARPMGSGDEAMEIFCRKNTPPDSFESGARNNQGISNIFNNAPPVDVSQPKVNARRKSSLKSNALLTGLLSKMEENSSAKVFNDKEDIFADADECTNNTKSNHSTKNTVNGFDQSSREKMRSDSRLVAFDVPVKEFIINDKDFPPFSKGS